MRESKHAFVNSVTKVDISSFNHLDLLFDKLLWEESNEGIYFLIKYAPVCARPKTRHGTQYSQTALAAVISDKRLDNIHTYGSFPFSVPYRLQRQPRRAQPRLLFDLMSSSKFGAVGQ